MHKFSSNSFVNASSKFDDVCNWLSDIGIDYSRGRVKKYKWILSELAKYQQENKLGAYTEITDFQSIVNTFHETEELFRIYDGLSNIDCKDLKQRIKNSIKGSELYVMDNSDRSGRDFSFELTIAAKFAQRGFIIEFGDDADIKVVVDGNPFFVECKRLKSKKKIKKRIKAGLNQLSFRYNSSSHPAAARGLLALSVGKVINPKLGYMKCNTDQEAGDICSTYIERFLLEYDPIIQSHNDKRTLGVLVQFDSLAQIKDKDNLLTTCHEIGIINRVPEGSNEHRYFLHVCNRVFG